MKTAFKDGLTVGGKKYAVQIILKDSQSNPNRAGEVANDLILKDKVALMLTAGTPETANPVSDACEINEVPCISSVVPWQPWFFGRKGDPAKGFNWTYHMFWGLEDVIANFTNGWNSVQTNKKVGGLFPNDGDGNAWGDKELGFPKPLAGMGYTLTDPGRFQNGTQDFSAQIAAFKKDGVEIVTGVVIPPDAKTFLTQARQQGFKPKVITLGKALLFPGAIEALGELGGGADDRGVVEPVAPVHLVADQAEREGAGRGLRERGEEAVDAADRLRACALRGRVRCTQAQQERRREGRARRGRGEQPEHGSSARSSGARRARSRTSARRRSCSASGARARSTRWS